MTSRPSVESPSRKVRASGLGAARLITMISECVEVEEEVRQKLEAIIKGVFRKILRMNCTSFLSR